LTGGCSLSLKGGADGKYDNSHLFVESIDDVLSKVTTSIYRIETSTTFKVGEASSNLKIVGMAFSIDEKHLLTAKHVTSIDSFQVQTP
jgi:hypothetical protein